jgi:hypothetical protein
MWLGRHPVFSIVFHVFSDKKEKTSSAADSLSVPNDAIELAALGHSDHLGGSAVAGFFDSRS